MALISIAGTEIKTPSEYTAVHADIVDSGRNAQGVTVAQVVRKDIAKINLQWNYLSVEDWSAILSIFKNSFFNDVTYFDQVDANYQTRSFYVSDRQGGMAQMKNGVPVGWCGCSLSLVEE